MSNRKPVVEWVAMDPQRRAMCMACGGPLHDGNRVVVPNQPAWVKPRWLHLNVEDWENNVHHPVPHTTGGTP